MEKAKIITCYECAFVALSIQHTMRMRHFIVPFIVCVPLPHSSTLSHNRQGFRNKVIEHKMRRFISILCLTRDFIRQGHAREKRKVYRATRTRSQAIDRG